ncbi:MAG: hypothetical protein HW416_1390 [Chloroflexi bacterium]|nr:hypothetical protein [Chloroflexota bacterium]
MLKDDYARTIKAGWERTTYGKWVRDEGVATYEGWFVEDVWKLETAPWPRLGARACFVTIYPMMEGQRGMYVVDMDPGAKLEPIHHLYEQIIMVLEGHGTTELWQEGDDRKHVFEWGRGSIFSPPLNTWYRMYNLSNLPAKFAAINRAPAAMNEFHNAEFVFNCPYPFRDRFNGEDGYFNVAPMSQRDSRNIWETNLIADALATDLDPADNKVAAGTVTAFHMAGNTLLAHLSQWPVGRYHKAHYHGAGAMLLGLRSEGYVLLWPSRAGGKPYTTGHEDDVVEVPWGRGSVYSPPNEWFHQHFNTGKEPARHLAVRGGNAFSGAPLGQDAQETRVASVDTGEGGTLLAYEDEDTVVRQRFRDALERNGVENHMQDELYAPGYIRAHSREAGWGER